MATAFIEYKNGRGFNIAEDYMQLMIYYIHKELTKSKYIFHKKNLFEIGHEGIINGIASGYLTLPWKQILINSSEELIMIHILKNVKDFLHTKGEFISVAELQSIPSEDEDFKLLYSRNPFPTSGLIKIIDALIQMLEGYWESTDYSMDINYRY